MTDTTVVANKLLSILGKRLSLYMTSLEHHDRVLTLSQMSPTVVAWINEQVITIKFFFLLGIVFSVNCFLRLLNPKFGAELTQVFKLMLKTDFPKQT